MKNIVIIGAGRAGCSLANVLFESKDFKINAISDKYFNFKAGNLRFLNNVEYKGASNKKAIEYGNIIIISTPDDIIEKVASELSELANINNKFFFHLSGSRESNILYKLKEKGAFIGSIHPLQSMPDPEKGADNLKNAYFCIEGDKEAVNVAIKIVKNISGKYFTIVSRYKYLYHAAAVFASNFINTTIYSSYSILKEIGIEEDKIIEILSPLMEGTINNIKNLGVFKSLTGPVIRGDLNTIKGHYESFEKFLPDFLKLYITLTEKTVELAKHTDNKSEYEDILNFIYSLSL